MYVRDPDDDEDDDDDSHGPVRAQEITRREASHAPHSDQTKEPSSVRGPPGEASRDSP